MNEQGRPRPAGADMRFLVVTAALLLLIIALLAGLWLSMRVRAARAERQLQQLRQERDARELFRRALAEAPFRVTVERETLETRDVTLDGRAVRALLLPGRLAEAMGLRPGDTVLVQQTTTAPATAPASRPAAGP